MPPDQRIEDDEAFVTEQRRRTSSVLENRISPYPLHRMTAMLKVYEEIINFIAAGVSPGDVSAFTPSTECRERVVDLLFREKTGALSAEEKSELEHYLQIEHLMRLAKARARQCLALRQSILNNA